MDIPQLTHMGSVSGKRVFVRVDFNVPVQGGRVVNDYRIKVLLPTIEYLRKGGAKVILASHRGGAGENDLKPVSDHLKHILPHTYIPSTDLVVISEHIAMMKEGDVALLTNLRFWRGEEMAEERLGIDLSRLADLYVNEAFAASHRSHTSIVVLPKLLPSCAGFHFMEEVENLSRAFVPEEPFLFVLGGAKFATKQPLVEKFMKSANEVFIGGALANDFFVQQGYEVGRSLVSNTEMNIPEAIFKSPKLLLPVDVTVERGDKTFAFKKPHEVLADDRMVDVGPETGRLLREKTEKAKFILWNGPLGIYEEGVVAQTEELAIAIAESEGVSIVGGGDTVAAIARLQLEDAFDFVSTGGGAMLEFLLKETLPGIEALKSGN